MRRCQRTRFGVAFEERETDDPAKRELLRIAQSEPLADVPATVTTYTVVESSLMLQVIALSAIAMVVTIGAVSTWTAFGAMLRQYLHTEKRRRAFNYSMAGLLVLSIIPVFFE